MALLLIAALLNAGGYALSLWHDRTIFDEAAHLYTTFAVVAAIGRIAAGTIAWRRYALRVWPLIVVGILVGIAWEVFEWAIGILGSRRDTVIDLIMDTAGAALAAVLLRLVMPKPDND